MRYARVDYSRIAYPGVTHSLISGVLSWNLLKRVYRQEDGVELRAVSRMQTSLDGENLILFDDDNTRAYRIEPYHQRGSDPEPSSFLFRVRSNRQRSLSMSGPSVTVKGQKISQRTRRDEWRLVACDNAEPFYVYFDSTRRLLYIGAKDRLSVFIVGTAAGEKHVVCTANALGRGFDTDAVETLTKKTLDNAKVNATLLYMQPLAKDFPF